MKTILMLIVLVFTVVPNQKGYAQKKNTASPPSDSTAAADELSSFSRSLPEYKSEGKRDPFGSLVPEKKEEGKEIKGLFNFEKANLSGIVITDVDKYALVIDADGFGHVLREGYMVYGGYVTAITDDSVYLHIVKYGRAMLIVLRLESSELTVITDEDSEMVVKKPGINISYEKSHQLKKSIRIEDIVVPSLNTKTVEEVWFGEKRELPVIEETSGDSDDSVTSSFSLFDPSHDSWIRLPYELNWTNYSGDGITYMLTIDDNSDFEKPFIIKEEVNESSYLLIEDMELPLNKQLFWKVVAVDETGVEQPSRQPYLSFKIVGNK